MPSYNEFFKHRIKVLLPVIHVVDQDQALRNAQKAFESGADGIFLISHDPRIKAARLISMYQHVRSFFEKHFIGINFLDLTTSDAIRSVPDSVSGLWVDQAGYNETGVERTKDASWYNGLRKDYFANGVYFGNVAFKYQEPVEDIAKTAREMKPYVDVLVTSGPQTGEPPPLEKIKAMHEALEGGILFCASGMTPENIGPFLPYLSGVMVSTGVSVPDDPNELDTRRLRSLRKRLDMVRV